MQKVTSKKNPQSAKRLFASLTLLTGALVVLLTFQFAQAQQKRFIVKLKEGATIVTSGAPTALPLPGSSVVRAGLSITRSAIATQNPSRRALGRGGVAVANPLERILIVNVLDSTSGVSEIRRFFGAENLEYIEEDSPVQLFSIPDDNLFPRQWHLQNDGQSYTGIDRIDGDENDTTRLVSGSAGQDIGLRMHYTSPYPIRRRPVIAVIDTGVDDLHPELSNALWRNPDEIPGNGLDDDHNGLVDDTWGYDFSGDLFRIINIVSDNDPSDLVGHGSHVAGIIASAPDGVGVVGVCPQAEIMSVKIFPNAFATVSAEAIVYAVNSGADVLNISWGAQFPSKLLEEAFAYAVANDVFVAVASGNSGNNQRFQPANIPELFTVGATNSDGFVTSFSTYGAHVDISAPGRDILSIRADTTDMFAPFEPGVRIVDSIYYLSDGTSMATPMVAGAAGFLKSIRPELSAQKIADALSRGARDIVQPFDTGAQFPGPDSLSGAGFLDIGRSLALISGPALTFADPPDFSRVSGNFSLKALPIEGFNGPWELSFSAREPANDFAPLAQGAIPPPDSVLFFYTDTLPGGLVTFRLIANSDTSITHVFISRPALAKITAPVAGDTVRYVANIRGQAHAEDYQTYTLTLRRPDGSLKLLGNGTSEFYGDVINTMELGSEESGDYTIFLSVFTSSETLRDSVNIFVRSTLAPGWPVEMPDFTGLTPVAADLDGDAVKELIVGTRSGMTALDINGNTLAGFPIAQNLDCRSVPLITDITGDSLPEIIFTSDSGLHVVSNTGTPLPGWPKKAPTGQVFLGFPTPQILRLAPEQDEAIVFVNAIGQLRAFHFDGVSYFYSLGGLYTRIDPNLTNNFLFKGLSIPQVTTVDMNHDGRNELLAVYSSPGATSGLFAFSGRDGQPAFWRASARTLSVRLTYGVALGDVDSDGNTEALVSGVNSDNDVSLWLRRNGEEDLPGWPIVLPELNDWIGHYPVLADVNADDIPEAIFVFSEFDISKVLVYNIDGSPFIEREAVTPGEVFSIRESLASPSVADIDGDGIAELVMRSGFVFPGTGFERIHAITAEGVEIDGFPIITTADPASVTSAGVIPLIDDIDDDGLLEVALIGSESLLHVWDLDAPVNPRRWDWPRFLQNDSNNGVGGETR